MIMASIFLSAIFLSLIFFFSQENDAIQWINIARPVVRFNTIWKGKKGKFRSIFFCSRHEMAETAAAACHHRIDVSGISF
jgi:hypothetical protein